MQKKKNNSCKKVNIIQYWQTINMLVYSFIFCIYYAHTYMLTYTYTHTQFYICMYIFCLYIDVILKIGTVFYIQLFTLIIILNVVPQHLVSFYIIDLMIAWNPVCMYVHDLCNYFLCCNFRLLFLEVWLQRTFLPLSPHAHVQFLRIDSQERTGWLQVSASVVKSWNQLDVWREWWKTVWQNS